jgi:hypothetical protein
MSLTNKQIEIISEIIEEEVNNKIQNIMQDIIIEIKDYVTSNIDSQNQYIENVITEALNLSSNVHNNNLRNENKTKLNDDVKQNLRNMLRDSIGDIKMTSNHVLPPVNRNLNIQSMLPPDSESGGYSHSAEEGPLAQHKETILDAAATLDPSISKALTRNYSGMFK